MRCNGKSQSVTQGDNALMGKSCNKAAFYFDVNTSCSPSRYKKRRGPKGLLRFVSSRMVGFNPRPLCGGERSSVRQIACASTLTHAPCAGANRFAFLVKIG